MFLYLFLLPPVMYTAYGLWTLAFFPIIMHITLGIYVTADAIKEPFADADNPYMDLDLLAWAHDTCREVDERFDMFVREARCV